ncbi:MAG: IS4 family transposase [bacterium]
MKKRTALELETEIAQFSQRVSQLFNEQLIDAEARATDFVERESKLSGHLFLSVFTFGMSIYGTPSLNDLVGLLNLVAPHLEITRQGLHERIHECAVAFFEKMLAWSISLELPQRLTKEVQTLCPHFQRILILDSTSFQLPRALARYFRGSGGGGSEAAVKILFGYDFKGGQFFYRLTDGVTHDHLSDCGFLQGIAAGDLEISDLGFFNIAAFAHMDASGAFYLSRLRPDVKVYQFRNGELEEFDLVRFAQQLRVSHTEIEVYLKKTEIVTKTRLIIAKVPDQVKAQRLRKLNHISRKKGYTTRKRVKILAGFNLYLTNALATALASEHIRALYGIRWQIELIFKSWKSNFALAKVTGKRSERIKCILYAKLLLIMITTKICIAVRNYVWLTAHRELSIFQATKYLKIVAFVWLITIIQNPKLLSQPLTSAMKFMSKRCLKGKSKKRVYPLPLLEALFA